MITEDAKARAAIPPRTMATTTSTSGASSSTLGGLAAEQLVTHEAARLNDPYVMVSTPNDGDDKNAGGVSQLQPFPGPRRVSFLDTLVVPDSFDANESDTGTFLPARSTRPNGSPKYDQFGNYIPHPDSEPYSPEGPDDQDLQLDAQPRDPPTEEELPMTSGPPEALRPNNFLQDLTKAMDGMDGTDEMGDQDASMHSADDSPTLVASPPVETASPTGSPGDLCVTAPPTEDPWETTDPWTALTVHEEADGWNAQVDATQSLSTP